LLSRTEKHKNNVKIDGLFLKYELTEILFVDEKIVDTLKKIRQFLRCFCIQFGTTIKKDISEDFFLLISPVQCRSSKQVFKILSISRLKK
jgi:hypothetical protein